MAIISSNIGDNDFSLRKKELRLVDSKIIPEETRNNNLNLARPITFQEFIGQEQLKSSLRIAIDASIYRKEPLEHTLLYGPPGLCKTTLAFLIANEMNTKCRIATAPAIERPRDIVGLLLGLKEGEVLFIDEIHRLNRLTEELLYSNLKSSIAEYNNSSVNLFKRCISSINKTSPSFNPSSNPTISLGLSIAGAEDILHLVCISWAIKKAKVVFPKPGWP